MTSFWKGFAKTHWEKQALVEKNFDSPTRHIDEDQIFSMLVALGDQCRKKKTAAGFKFYINGELQYDFDTIQILPRKKDRSLKNYHAQMAKMFSDYCLVCDELLQASEQHWPSLHELTRDIFEHVGFPNRFAELGLYLGNYRKTPFGVHVDGCGVFSFPVIGHKKFRLWTSAFAKKKPDLVHAHEYSQFKKHSQVLTVKPGDMAYWPSSAWHIAESDGSFSTTWSLGVWIDRTHRENLHTALSPLLNAKVEAHGNATMLKRTPPRSDGQVSQLPDPYEKSLAALATLSKEELHDSLLKHWLELSSLEGFKNSHRADVKVLTAKSELRLRPARKILWAHLKAAAKTAFAYQGKVIEAEESADLLRLIQNLNKDSSCRISDYLKNSMKKRDLQSLQMLADVGAFI